MSSFWAKFSEPLPNAPIKPNNASAIFGGHSPYGLRATEPSIFRPTKEKPKTRKSGRSSSDAGLLKTSEKQKTKDSSSKRKLSETRLKSNTVQNSTNNNRPVSPRSNGKESPVEENTDENNLADSTDSSGSNGDRYPRFISVVKKGAAAAEGKTRKPTNELNSDKTSPTFEQPTEVPIPKEQSKAVKRSSSFSATRKTSESQVSSKSPVKLRGVCHSQTGIPTRGKSPVDSFRREKSDIIVRPRGSYSPSSNRRENTALSNSKGAHSPSALKREKSDISPRLPQPGFGILRENSDLVRPRGSASPIALRREKSDIVSPRRSPGIGKRQKSDIFLKKKTLNSATPNSSTISSASQSETLNKLIEHNMSKIPTPGGTNTPSKIPSFAKTSSIPQSKIPSKSKIPSFGKADKKDEQPKKSQIPTGIPRSDKSVSKIAGPPRPDSAKENKDPAINRKESEEEEPPKPVNNDINKISRIPSAKGASTVSKLPRQDSQEKKSKSTEDDTNNVFAVEHETVDTSNATEKVVSPQSRIPSLSSSNQTSNIPTGLSKIPSFSKTNTPSKPTFTTKSPENSEVTSSGSKIPQGIGTGIPSPTVHAKPETTHTGIPPPKVHAKPQTGIWKPETIVSGIPKPEGKASTPVSGIPKPEIMTSPTSTESKLPQLSHSDSTPRCRIPGLPGSMLTRKLSEEKFKKSYEKPAEKTAETPKEETTVKPIDVSFATTSVSTPGVKVAPPPPPPRQDVTKEETMKEEDESPMDKYIFSEAKRMEELLRNESIVVEIPKDAPENEAQAAEKPKNVEAKGELNFMKGPEVKEMTTGYGEVCEDNVNEAAPQKEDTQKEPVSFSTFGKKEDPSTNEKATPKETPKQDVKQKKELKTPPVQEKAEGSSEKGADAQSPVDESKPAPAIDTLGQYEQQARRSRSRQRKVISPDSEQAETTFDQAASEDDAKKVIDKDKFGTQPFQGDETKDSLVKPANKPAKIKSKFVIESSLGADFYQSKTSQSKESVTEDVAEKPSEVIVIQNKTFDDSKAEKPKDVSNNKKTRSKGKRSSEAFEDVELSSNKGSKTDMKAWSTEQLDEKTVKCGCGRGGKCSIM